MVTGQRVVMICDREAVMGRHIEISIYRFGFDIDRHTVSHRRTEHQWLNYSKVGGGTLHFLSSLPLEVGPINSARGSGGAL